MSTQITFFLAFLVVLALIGGAAWLVRRFASDRLKANGNRGRMPRLAVIDATAVDGRRRLVLVRRDNIEHLLMIGGPSDIVVETNIVRAMPSREQAPGRPNSAADGPPRIPSFPDSGSWTDGDTPSLDEPALPEPPPRPSRPSFADETRRPAPALLDRREPLSFTPDPPPRPDPVARSEPRPEMRSEPMPPRAPPRNEPMMPRPPIRQSEPPPPRSPPLRAPDRAAPPPPLPASADQNLADMANRLEAALRRPGGDSRDTAEPRLAAPPVAPDAPSGRPSRGDAPPSMPGAGKGGFENLEDEMASLLGRPKTPS